MATFRVLWTDDQVGGRWQDVESDDEAHATWQAAATAGQGTTFLAVAALPAPPGD